MDYLHMNRFFTLNMFKHPALAPYEYYIRLDTDLFVKKEMSFDIFKRMKKEGLVFAYWNRNREPNGCVVGLGDATKDYLRERELYVPWYIDEQVCVFVCVYCVYCVCVCVLCVLCVLCVCVVLCCTLLLCCCIVV